MSSPMEHPSDLNDMFAYAPKWVRNRELRDTARLHSDPMRDNPMTHDPMTGQDYADVTPLVPQSSPYEPSRYVQIPPSPPDDGGGDRRGRVMAGSFMAVLLAAGVAFIVVWAGPAARSLLLKQKASATVVAERADKLRGSPPAQPAQTYAMASADSAGAALPRPKVEPQIATSEHTVDAERQSPAWAALPAPQADPAVWTDPAQAPKANPDVIDAKPAAAAHPAPPDSISPPEPTEATSPTVPPKPVAAEHPARVANIPTNPDDPSEQSPESAPVRHLGADAIDILLKQGNGFVADGDFSSARIVFERIAQAGDERGALSLAATYDPIALARLAAKGVVPDVAKAREWYLKAATLGSKEAKVRLDALNNWRR